jgi:hypothetical protein
MPDRKVHPEVDDPPAEVGVEHLALEGDHARQVEHGRGRQAEEQHDAGGGEAFAVERRHPDDEDEQQHVDDHQVVEGPRDLEELSPLPPAELEADQGDDPHDHQAGPLHDGELHAPEFALGLGGNDQVGGPHEAREQPHHQQVQVARAGRVERDHLVQDVEAHVGKAHDEPEDDLEREEQQGGCEEEVGHTLGSIFHDLLLSALPEAHEPVDQLVSGVIR